MPEPRGRDLNETRIQLTRWLTPRFEGAEVELGELGGPSDTGFSSDTLIFDAMVRERGEERRERLVARLEPRGFNVFPDYDVSAQFRIMRVLGEKTDVPVPRMRWLEEGEDTLGVPFYVMDRIDGRAPNDNPPMHTTGWVAELEPSDRETLWWRGLDAMCRVHRVDWESLGLGFLDAPERGPDPASQEVRYYEDYFEWAVADVGRYPVIRAGLDWLKSHLPKDEPKALCWGDSRMSNLMFDGLECVAVIDWEMARLGNPLMDMAWWVSIDRCLTEGIGIPRLEGFPGYEQSVARWSSSTGFSAEHLDFYCVLAVLKFSVIMARLGLQMKHYEILPEDAEMDANNMASSTLERMLDDVPA